MANIYERLLKAESDARYAVALAAENKAVNDYNILMGNIEDPAEEEEDEEDE